MLVELHVTDDVGSDWAGYVSERRTTKAGMKLLGNSGATRLRTTLEYQRLQSCSSQIKGSDQAIVSPRLLLSRVSGILSAP